jgi:two-component system, NtrC family, sensor kinase
MKIFLDLPIKKKLTLLAMATSCVALLAACISFVIYEQMTFRRSMVRDLGMVAEMTGANSTAGLAFDDPSSVEQTLQSLQTEPRVMWACVYSKTGGVVAKYERSNLIGALNFPKREEKVSIFRSDRLDLFRPIWFKGELLGTIYVASDLQEMRDRLWRYIWIVSLVLLSSSLLAFALVHRLQRFISEPVHGLAETVAAVSRERNYSLRAEKHGNDELGTLIDGFNEMLSQIERQDSALQEARNSLELRVQERTGALQLEIEERKQAEIKLAETHKQLLTASRQAGMAEVATGVLHNVGNVLNSVNVAATLLDDSLRKSEVEQLRRVMSLLGDNRDRLGLYITEDPKGKRIPEFLSQLTNRLEGDNARMRQEVATLRKNIEHIKDIVAMQQSYAKVSGLVETLNIVDLVEDSLRMNLEALVRHDVILTREFDEVPQVTTDKHKVLQILINLIRNAKYACDDSGKADKRLAVKVNRREDRVRVVVVDNGIGIPPQNLTAIFQHGFTTRHNGHGFGLHSGALAAKELGGALIVESLGLGHGATFTLELPISPKRN